MANSTRCKFRVNGVRGLLPHGPRIAGDWTPEQVEVDLLPVYGAEGENHEFWKATPSGSIKLTISNPDAFAVFSPGTEFYVDFTCATPGPAASDGLPPSPPAAP